MSEIIVSLQNVNKSFGSNHVIRNLDLEIRKGEFLTLLGPSGCGKTTILRLIAGFETATSGTILVEGEHVEEKEPFQRDVNTVFQNYALFPHMTVYDNVAYGLTVKKVPKNEIRERVTEMLQLVQLPGFENRKPDMMSGGQKQRVAIARALINRPKVLLLDEPLGALDLKLRKQMQIELKRLQKKLNITFVYVTHDQEEALTMSDRIAVMNAGILDQLDTPDTIYKKPGTKFVAGFIGESNLFEGTVETVEGNIVKAAGKDGEALVETTGFQKGQQIYISVRPEDTKMSKEPVAGFSIKGTLKDVIFIGSHLSTHITLESGNEVKINRSRDEGIAKEGDTVFIYWDKEDAVGISELGGGVSALPGGEADE